MGGSPIIAHHQSAGLIITLGLVEARAKDVGVQKTSGLDF